MEKIINSDEYIRGYNDGLKDGQEMLSKENIKRKETFKNIKHQQQQNNSQYGTCWMWNEKLKENKKVKKEELQKWLDDGWTKGRKIKV